MRLGSVAVLTVLLFTAIPALGQTTSVPLPSCTITITPASTYVGSPVLVKWTSANASGGTITPTIGNVGPSGSKSVFPPSKEVYTTYRGSFTGPGGTAVCQAGVSVSPEPEGYTGGSGSTGDGGSSSGGGFFGTLPTGGGTGGTVTTGGSGIGSFARGIVPCGNPGQEPCQACHLVQLAENIVNFFIYFSIAVATLMFAWAGILYVSSSTNPKNIETAHSIFWSVFVGLIIVLSAWLIVDVIMKTFVNESKFGPWNKIQCVGQPGRTDSTGFRPSTNPELGGSSRREGELNAVSPSSPQVRDSGQTDPGPAPVFDTN